MAGARRLARATRIAPSKIGRGLEELAGTPDVAIDRNRRAGGERKTLTARSPALLDDLLALVSPSERGDPMSTIAPDMQRPAPPGQRIARHWV
jgi:hypothetical protein